MQSSTETITLKTITLVLDEEEAEWLHGNMQNPLHGLDAMEETSEDAMMRLKFFNATR